MDENRGHEPGNHVRPTIDLFLQRPRLFLQKTCPFQCKSRPPLCGIHLWSMTKTHFLHRFLTPLPMNQRWIQMWIEMWSREAQKGSNLWWRTVGEAFLEDQA